MIFEEIIMSNDTKDLINQVIVTSKMLGYEISFSSSDSNFYIFLDGDVRYSLILHVTNNKLNNLWVNSNRLFRCSSVQDFNGDDIKTLKVFLSIFQN